MDADATGTEPVEIVPHNRALLDSGRGGSAAEMPRAPAVTAIGSRNRGGWAAVGMTQQYLSGELSLLLAQLQAVAIDQAFARAIAQLRREAETSPPAALNGVLIRTLEVTDGLCWDSLARGDTTAFNRQAAGGAELREFGVCAGLLEEAA